MIATLEKNPADKLESLFKTSPSPISPPPPLFVSGLSAPMGRKIIGRFPRGSASNPPSNMPVTTPSAPKMEEGQETMPAPKRMGPKATKEGLEIREYFKTMHRAGKPIPTYKEYCKLTNSKVNGGLYNTAKANFLKSSGTHKERPGRASLPPDKLLIPVKQVLILSTIPGPIPSGLKELLEKAFADAAKSKGIRFGKLSFVKLADPEALEIREEVT